MATNWIKLEHTTPDKPEVVQIATLLKIDQDAVVGKLLRLWIWADQNSVDGSDMAVTAAFIDRLTNRRGFSAALRAAGWLHGEDGALTFGNFSRHNGATAKARAMENRKKQSQRERDETPPETEKLPLDCPDDTGTNDGTKMGTRGRGRGREGGGEDASPPAPPIFQESQDQWLKRLESKWPQIKLAKELQAAQTNRQLQGKKLERRWFEEHWLANITPVVELGQVQTAAAVAPEPEGWRVYLKDNYDDQSWAKSAAAYTWASMPGNWRDRLTREMQGAPCHG